MEVSIRCDCKVMVLFIGGKYQRLFSYSSNDVVLIPFPHFEDCGFENSSYLANDKVEIQDIL